MSVLEKDFKVKKLTESRMVSVSHPLPAGRSLVRFIGRVEILQTLRVHGRRTQDADAIYSKQVWLNEMQKACAISRT